MQGSYLAHWLISFDQIFDINRSMIMKGFKSKKRILEHGSCYLGPRGSVVHVHLCI